MEVLNLYSLLTSKLNFRWNSDEDLNDPENDNYIKKAAESVSCVIVAWGKSANTNMRIASRAKAVLTLLKPHQAKVHVISDGTRDGLHPLTPALRTQWILKPFDWVAYEAAEAQAAEPAKEAVQNDTGK